MLEITIDEIFQMNQSNFDRKFELKDTLASGAFGTVHKAKEIKTNKDVAVKIICKDKEKSSAITQLKREVNVLKKANHPNIVQMYDFFETKDRIYIVMEYIKNGTLMSWMKRQSIISEDDTKIIIHHLLCATDHLHKIGICHRDIKPENIMFDGDNLSSLKLIDFGLSTQNVNNNNLKEEFQFCGTLLYMSPERILSKRNYTKEVDLWSIGIIMFMLLNKGLHPFHIKGESKSTFMDKFNNLNIKPFFPCSLSAANLMNKLLDVNPKYRETAAFALHHPWMKHSKEDINIAKTNASMLLLVALFFDNQAKCHKNDSDDMDTKANSNGKSKRNIKANGNDLNKNDCLKGDTSSCMTTTDKDKSCEDDFLSTKRYSESYSSKASQRSYFAYKPATKLSSLEKATNDYIKNKRSFKPTKRLFLLDNNNNNDTTTPINKAKERVSNDELIRNLNPKNTTSINTFLTANIKKDTDTIINKETLLNKKTNTVRQWQLTEIETTLSSSKKFKLFLQKPNNRDNTPLNQFEKLKTVPTHISTQSLYSIANSTNQKGRKTSNNFFTSDNIAPRQKHKTKTVNIILLSTSYKSSFLLPSIVSPTIVGSLNNCTIASGNRSSFKKTNKVNQMHK